MPIADPAAAIAKLRQFVALLDQKRDYTRPDNRQAAFDDDINRHLESARRIASAVNPELINHFMPATVLTGWPWNNARAAAMRLIGDLEGQDEMERIIGPAGPQLAAVGLHRWVWGAAATLWDGGHYREAVQAAATQVETHTKLKLEVDLDGPDLWAQAFTLDAAKGDRPRPRFVGSAVGTKDFTNRHQGAMHYGKGLYQAIRNPATHNLDQPAQQEALEYLAGLSVLARWVDEATVERAG